MLQCLLWKLSEGHEMRIREFLDGLREAAMIAQMGSLEPEIIIRREDGTEFTPVKIKASSSRIIICEDERG